MAKSKNTQTKSAEEVVDIPGLKESVDDNGNRVIIASPPLFNTDQPQLIVGHSSEREFKTDFPPNTIYSEIDTNDKYRLDENKKWIKLKS